MPKIFFCLGLFNHYPLARLRLLETSVLSSVCLVLHMSCIRPLFQVSLHGEINKQSQKKVIHMLGRTFLSALDYFISVGVFT